MAGERVFLGDSSIFFLYYVLNYYYYYYYFVREYAASFVSGLNTVRKFLINCKYISL